MSEDINIEVIKSTQKILGKYVKKPPLTEKLLRKPPFRFLHDVIKGVIKETGFLKGLFSEYELNCDNVKDKNAKINFLTKLIDAVKKLTDGNFNVRAGKIVAGLEPEKTNLLLQAIGKAIDSKISSSEYVKNLHTLQEVKSNDKKNISKKANVITKTNKLSRDKNSISKQLKTTTKETPKSTRSTPKESPKITNNIKSKQVRNEKERTFTQDAEILNEDQQVTSEHVKVTTDDDKNEKVESIITEGNSNQTDNAKNNFDKKDDQISLENRELQKLTTEFIQEAKPSVSSPEVTDIVKADIPRTAVVRPKSARPKSGGNEKVKIDEGKPLEMKVSQSVQRPKSSLRPPSVRPSSARPGAPRLRPDSALPSTEPVLMGNINVIVESVDNIDDEETVIIENNPEVIEDSTATDISLKNKGHLVEQILEQIKDGETISHVEVDWNKNAIQTNNGTSKELFQLRALIQNLTRTANPLGKLMNYLHEDLDAMYSELQLWTNTKKQLYVEIQKQKRLNIESNKPLLSRLEQLEQDFKKQHQEISHIQSNILRNESRIKELIEK